MEYLILAIVAFAAGFIDSVAGGGGLIHLPGLMLVFPHVPFPVLSGTNKIASICGTTYATFRYMKVLPVDKHVLWWSIPFALCASFLGAHCISYLSPNLVKPIVIFALLVVGIYTAVKPELGAAKPKERSKQTVAILAAVIGLVLGFYDGFIGPGTGSILLFAFVVILGLDFLHASATAKAVNIGTNFAAVIYFTYTGQFLAEYALVMAAASVAGAHVGTKMALSKGNSWIKKVFLLVIIILLGRLVWDLVIS